MSVAGCIHANGPVLSNLATPCGKKFVLVKLGSLISLIVAALLYICPASPVRAMEVFALTLKDHHFAPAELHVPASERFRIEVENLDPTPAEFESADLRVEKIVVGGGKITVLAGPLRPGTYKFFDDYHPDLAKGTITASERAAH